MDDNTRTAPSTPELNCPKTRLAEGALASVDICRCGMLQLHIGALTLRMAPCALAELLSTLGQAVAAHSTRRFFAAGTSDALAENQLEPTPNARLRRGRGDA